jgi:uncharacterized membrane protein YfcA
MDGMMFWIAASVAATLVGMSKGGLPLVGMLCVPVLSLVISPVTAAGLLLPVFVLSDVFGLYAYRREFDSRVLAILVLPMTLGVGIGWATASVVPEQVVTLLVGLIGAAFALNLILRPRLASGGPASVAKGAIWGTLSGFTSFVSHAGAPPYQVFVLPLGLSKTVFAGTSTIIFAYVNAIKLIPYYALGQLNTGSLRTALVLMPIAAVAVFAGVRLVKILPEALFFRLVTWALLAVSAKLIWDGISG